MSTFLNRYKVSISLILVLLLLTCVSSALHLTTTAEVQDTPVFVADDVEQTLEVSTLPLEPFTGEIVNGKGETTSVEKNGIALSALVESMGIAPEAVETFSVTASDGFAAEVTGEELCQEGNCYLAVLDDGSLRMYVFGDSNSKRSVKNVVRVTVTCKGITVSANGTSQTVYAKDLTLSEITGEQVNGKGETKTVSGNGIALSELFSVLEITGYQNVTVTAGDGYTAAFTAEEVAQPDNVVLYFESDGTVRLVVFGDSNAKRSLKNVVSIDAE